MSRVYVVLFRPSSGKIRIVSQESCAMTGFKAELGRNIYIDVLRAQSIPFPPGHLRRVLHVFHSPLDTDNSQANRAIIMQEPSDLD